MGNRWTSAAYRELGGMLRRAREKAGLSETELARKLGWTMIMVSRMELGWRSSTTTDVIQYLVMCGVMNKAAAPYVEFTRLAERRQGYHLSDDWIDGSLQSLILHESMAQRSIIYEPQVIHGLLQTPGYAHSLIAAINADAEDDWVAGVVRTRMERCRVLSLPEPAHFTFFLHEQSLRLRIGSDEIMQEQLLHIVLTAAMGNVTVRILPSVAGERSAVGGAFRLMEFAQHRPIVYLDYLGGSGLILDDPRYVSGFRELVPMLAEVALDEGQSREFVAELANEYDRRSQQGDLAEEQLQRRVGIELRGGGVEEEQLQRGSGVRLCGGGVGKPTAIYE
jgi:Domain of unknown function (DUF5753)/Helix-turn-helix domain